MMIILVLITILLVIGSLPLKASILIVLFGTFSPKTIHITMWFLRLLHTKQGATSHHSV